MPFAVALLLHPAGSFAALVVAIVAGMFAVQSRRFLPAFTAAAAASLTVLAFLQLPPSPVGLLWLGIGLAALHAEFSCPLHGSFGLVGLTSTAYGSWSLLSPLATLGRLFLAVAAALLLLAVVGRTMRLRTLRP